jgi:Transposase and inactivated derivatives
LFNYKLSTKELSALKLAHKSCRQRVDADRIKAVYLLGKGWSINEVVEALLLEDDAIRRYFRRYKEDGVTGLLTHLHQGKSSNLTDAELGLLEAHLKENLYPTVAEIIAYVEQEFDVVYTESGLRNVLKQLDFVYKKPEKIPFRVNEVEQRKFVNRYRRLKRKLGKADGLYFMDATHPEHTPIPAYGWIKRGETKVLKSNPMPYRLNINGAVNIDTLEMVVRIEPTINKETTLAFLSALRKHQPQGWIYLVCDNAGYYTSPDVQAYAKALAIKLIYLPPYAPNLNLIERVWKFFKKQVLYNKHYPELSHMRKATQDFFKKIGNHHEQLRFLLTENFQIITE